MNGSGLLIILAHLVTLGDYTPETPVFKQHKIICRDIIYTFTTDGYKYVGISAGTKNYLTNYDNSDTLQKEIDRQCKN